MNKLSNGYTVKLIRDGLGVITAASAVIAVMKEFHKWVDGRIRYEVTIKETDPIYPLIQAEVLSQLKPQQLRKLKVQSKKTNQRINLQYFYDNKRATYFTINGVKIRLFNEKANEEGLAEGLPNYLQERIKESRPDIIALSVGTVEDFDVLQAWLAELTDQHNANDNPPVVKVLTSWGSWRTKGPIQTKDRESLVLAEGQLEELIEDLDDFLSSRDFYLAKNLPYHRGYLLYGPPGTGKTSIVQLLAHHANKDLQFMSLASIKDDGALQDAISGIESDSFLLIEDIDANRAPDRDDDEADKPTLSGLLNSLDGVLTPDGLVTFITTNNIESLDEALIREGRIDRRVSVDYADASQVKRLYENFYETPLPAELIPRQPVSPAKIMEVFKRNRKDPDQAYKDLFVLCGD